jgi:hypothetical protein
LSGIWVTSAISVMPPPGHTYAGAPPRVTLVKRARTERVSRTGFSVTPARSEPPAPAMNNTVASDGSQFSPIRSTASRTRLAERIRLRIANRTKASSSPVIMAA